MLLSQISTLLDRKLDEKLTPLATAVDQVKTELNVLTKQVHDNKQASNETINHLSSSLSSLRLQTEGQFEVVDLKISKLEELLRERTSGFDTADYKRVNDKEFTLVVGGLGEHQTYDDAKTWLENKLWERWLPQPVKTYTKGDFKGMLFCKYASKHDRDLVVEDLRPKHLACNGKNVWSKPDLPLNQRVSESVLFALKRLMVSWSYEKKSLWVDKDTNSLKIGGEIIMKVSVKDQTLAPSFGDGWYDHIRCDEFEQVINDADAKLKSTPTKGLGKGKKEKTGAADE